MDPDSAGTVLRRYRHRSGFPSCITAPLGTPSVTLRRRLLQSAALSWPSSTSISCTGIRSPKGPRWPMRRIRRRASKSRPTTAKADQGPKTLNGSRFRGYCPQTVQAPIWIPQLHYGASGYSVGDLEAKASAERSALLACSTSISCMGIHVPKD